MPWRSVAAEDAAQKPEVRMLVPLSAIVGTSAKLKVRGAHLDTATEVRVASPGATVKFISAGKASVPGGLNAAQAGDTQVEFELTCTDELAGREIELTFVTPAGEVRANLPVLAARQAILEVEPNPGFKQSQPIELSQTILGQISNAHDVDVYAIDLSEGQYVRIGVIARRLGSAIDALVWLADAAGETLLTNDDAEGSRDAVLEWQAIKSSRYYVIVQDANDSGGEAMPYRLLVEPIARPVSFASQVAPILQQHCVACHGERKAEGGYRLDSFARLTTAGQSGRVGFAAHGLDQSESFRRVLSDDSDERMPLNSEPLSAEKVALLRTWIEEGLRFDGRDSAASLITLIPPKVHPAAPTTYAAPTPIDALAFSPDGNELLVGGYHEVTVWRPSDGALLRRIGNIDERVTNIAFHPDGQEFAVACGAPGQWGEVRVFSVDGQLRRVFGASSDVIHDLSFDPTGTQLATARADAKLDIYRWSSGELIREISGHLDWVLAVAWSADGRKIASGSRDKTAKVFEVATGKTLASYSRHESAVRGVLFHPSGEEVYSSGANQRWDRWQLIEAKPVRDMGLGGEGFKLVPVGDFFLVASTNNRVHQMKAMESERVREFQAAKAQRFLSAAAHLGSDRIAAGSQQGNVVIWELSTGKQIADFAAVPRSGD